MIKFCKINKLESMQLPDHNQCSHLETNSRTKRALISTIEVHLALCMYADLLSHVAILLIRQMYGICLVNFSRFRSVGVASKPTKGHFALTIGAHWRKMRPLDPSWRPIAQFEKTKRRIRTRIILKWYWCCVAIHFCLKF